MRSLLVPLAAAAFALCSGLAHAQGNATPVYNGPLTILPLDVSTVTTGGTAVTALSAFHKSKGGWIRNPENATVNLCINEQGAASGTSSNGNTSCVSPGQTYQLTPSLGSVSVVSSDANHPFSGQGYQ